MNARLSSIMTALEEWNELQAERVRLLRIHRRAVLAGLSGIRALVERRVNVIDERMADVASSTRAA